MLNPDAADLALLRADLQGTADFAKRPDWKVIYYDDTAVLLVHNADRFPKLAGLTLPATGSKDASIGRAAFGRVE